MTTTTRSTLTRLLGLGALAVALGGCQTPPGFEPEAAEFGNAVRQNAAAQLANPEPVPAAAPVELDGHRAALMIGRYKADKVEPPMDLRTSGIGGGGG